MNTERQLSGSEVISLTHNVNRGRCQSYVLVCRRAISFETENEWGTVTVHHAIQKGWESPVNNLVVDESILITRPYCHLAGSGVSPLPYQ